MIYDRKKILNDSVMAVNSVLRYYSDRQLDEVQIVQLTTFLDRILGPVEQSENHKKIVANNLRYEEVIG